MKDLLESVIAPFVILKSETEEERKWLPGYLYQPSGKHYEVRTLRGRKMRSYQSLMDECGAALQFFEGFGENWNALLDCLRSLDEWMPAEGFVIVVSHA